MVALLQIHVRLHVEATSEHQPRAFVLERFNSVTTRLSRRLSDLIGQSCISWMQRRLNWAEWLSMLPMPAKHRLPNDPPPRTTPRVFGGFSFQAALWISGSDVL
jgi:hypothetical protein